MLGASAVIMEPRFTVAPRRGAGPDADELLSQVAASGDRSAFSALYVRFAPRVKAYLMRSGEAGQEAEELAQECMLKVWRSAALFDPGKASAATWIYAIARNVRIDALRRRRRIAETADDSPPAPERESSPEVLLERGDRDRLVRRAFDSLPQKQRDVVALHFFGEEPHSAIARKLDLPLGTVKSRLRLALERFRQALGDLE
jgi:RNA polymerase sigma-70 factor (ECF subfamily)